MRDNTVFERIPGTPPPRTSSDGERFCCPMCAPEEVSGTIAGVLEPSLRGNDLDALRAIGLVFDENGLAAHVIETHANRSGVSMPLVCPVCASRPGGDPSVSDCFQICVLLLIRAVRCERHCATYANVSLLWSIDRETNDVNKHCTESGKQHKINVHKTNENADSCVGFNYVLSFSLFSNSHQTRAIERSQSTL